MKKAMICLLVLSAAACGVKFKDAPVNASLPDDFKTRNFYDRTDIWKFKLPELVGSIIAKEPGSETYSRIKRIVKDRYTAALEIVPDQDRKVYSSRIDRGASVEGSYLLFAAGLQMNQMAEVTIEDVSLAFISDADAPWEKLRAEAAAVPPGSTAARYWIQGALLSAVTVSYYQEISASASGVVGETFGAKGKVYNKQGTTQKDFKISMTLYDLSLLDASTRGLPVALFRSPIEISRTLPVFKEALARRLVIKDIRE